MTQNELVSSLLGATVSGKFAYIWKAINTDGAEVLQFENKLFQQLLDDDAPVPANLDTVRSSVDKLDVRKVKEFVLIPTGVTRKHNPWAQPVRLVVDIEKGEKFISYWLGDMYPLTNTYLYRHVLGISKPVNGTQAKFFVVVSPIGKVTIATNDNQSYDGE